MFLCHSKYQFGEKFYYLLFSILLDPQDYAKAFWSLAAMILNDIGPKALPKGSTHAGGSNSLFCIQDDTRLNTMFWSTDHCKTKTLETIQASSEPVKLSEDDAAINNNKLNEYVFIENRQYM